MPRQLLLSTSDGYWRVIAEGMPACADTSEAIARQRLAALLKLPTYRDADVKGWNGDTMTYFDVEVSR